MSLIYTCQSCGEVLTYKKSRLTPPTACRSCQKVARSTRPEQCPGCGQHLTRRAGEKMKDFRKREHCNTECLMVANRRRTCSVDECDSRPVRRGLCRLHNDRLVRHGSTEDPRPSFDQRFWAKVTGGAADQCWLWIGATSTAGYGHIDGRLAHRVSYELLRHEIPEGLVLDHLCRTTRCVNPWHLDPVTQRVNILRGAAPTVVIFRERTGWSG